MVRNPHLSSQVLRMFTGLPFDTPCYQIVSLPLSHAMLSPVILDALTGRGQANPGKEMNQVAYPFYSNHCVIVQESQARVPRHLLAEEL